MDLIRGEGLFMGRGYRLFDTCCIKRPLSKLLFSIILNERVKFKHQSMSRPSSSSVARAYLRGVSKNLMF